VLTADGLVVESTAADPAVVVGSTTNTDVSLRLRRGLNDAVTDTILKNSSGHFYIISDNTSDPNKTRATFNDNGDISFYDSTGTTQGFFWDASTQRLGLGTTSPDGTAHIHTASAGSVTANTDADDLTVENSGNAGISILSPDASRSAIMFGHASDNLKMQIRHDGSTSLSQIISDDALTFNVIGGTERMRINDTGVGIGVSTPSGKLHLSQSGATNQAATIFSLDGYHSTFGANLAKSSGTYTTPAVSLSGGGWEYQPVNSLNNHGVMIYLSAPDTNTSASTPLERLRIDGSGNFLVGKSASDRTVAGGEILSSGGGRFTRDSADPLYLNRLTNNGNLISFRRNDSEIGTIGSYGNAYVNIGTGDVGLMFNTGGQAIIPHSMTANLPRSSSIDLGQSGYKWKDAYFSGYVYAAGFAGQSDGNTYVNFPGSDVMQLYTAGSERARLDAQGNLLWGTTSKDTFSVSDGAIVRQTGRFLGTTSSDSVAALSRRGTDGSIVALYKNTSLVGSISVTGSGTTYNTTSDIRLKQDIEPLVATDKLMAMNPVSYNWKADPDGPRSMGFIAQEMQEVMPEAVAVGDDEDAMMSMDYGRITPILVSALQDAHRKIEQLEQRIADMEAK
jgi:hypothetical protein